MSQSDGAMTVTDNGALLLDRIEESVGILQATQASVVEAARKYAASADAVSEASAGLVEKTDDLLAKIDGFAAFKDATGPYMEEQATTIAEIRQNAADAVETVNLAKNMANGAGAKAQEAADTADTALLRAQTALSKAEAVEGTANTAQVAAEAADAKAVAAQGIAADASTAAGVAQTAADNANTGLAALKAKVDDAETGLAATKAIADGALPASDGIGVAPTFQSKWASHSAATLSLQHKRLDSANWPAIGESMFNVVQFQDKNGVNVGTLMQTYSTSYDQSCAMSLNATYVKEDGETEVGSFIVKVNSAGVAQMYGPTPPANADGPVVPTIEWDKQHFIEQLTAERMYIGGGSTADKKVPAGGTWAYYTINMSTKGVAKGVCAGGSIITSGTDQICFAFRVA